MTTDLRLSVHSILTLALTAALAGCGAAPPGEPSVPTTPAARVTSPSGPSPSATSPSATSPSRPTASPPSADPTSPTPSSAGPTTPAPGQDTCAELATSLSLAEQVGQLFMVGVDSGGGLSSRQAKMMDEAHVGSAILLGNSTSGVTAVRRLTDEVRESVDGSAGVRMLLAADQEGGQVQRLQGVGFDRIPSAMEQSRQSSRLLQSSAERWGRQLTKAGIDADLAPVADVVPAELRNLNQPIGVLRRGYGPDPSTVAAKVAAFTRGMDAAGVATAVKHFPGLGAVRGNTDFQARVVDSDTTRDDADLAGFAAAVGANVDMVMISSAYYAKIDAKAPAAFSTTVVTTMVREDLGFTGVVISDDLAGVALQFVSPGERALRFLRAGGDLMIIGDPTSLPTMVAAVRRQARSNPAFAQQLTQHATRVLQLKQRRGLARCD